MVNNDFLMGYEAGKAAGGGGGSTLITKTITANGTYAASSDNADGYSEVTVNVPSGTIIQAPYKVASGSVVPASNTDHLQIDISSTGLSHVVHANLMIDDYTNYANYVDIAPVVLRQIWNKMNGIPELPYGGVSISNVALKADGALAQGTNGNNATFANGIVHFGFYWSGYQFKAGVTYNYIVVGV